MPAWNIVTLYLSFVTLAVSISCRGNSDRLSEEGAEISDILNSTFKGNLTDGQRRPLKQIFRLGDTQLMDIFGSLATCYSLYLAIELDAAHTEFGGDVFAINLTFCE